MLTHDEFEGLQENDRSDFDKVPAGLLLPSSLQVGQPCTVFGKDGYVRAVIFSTGKVRFSVRLVEEETTIHNIDSVYVENREGDIIDMGFDNYS